MPDLERNLVALVPYVDLPAERDLVPAVRARLRQPSRRHVPWRRAAAIAALVLVVGLAATMAVPDARTAVLRFLGIKGATVIRVDELPPAATALPEFGESVGIAEAQRVVGFRPLLIDGRQPDDVRINRFSPFFIVLLYGEPGVRLRLTEMVGGAIEKYALTEQQVERVEVDGEPGIWVEGRHVVYEPLGLPRLSGNVILWEQEGLTLRLEGRFTKEQALDLARSVR
ncbi:MAG: hypothetical protein ACRDLU_01015 [Gaiellaceae bacterium]